MSLVHAHVLNVYSMPASSETIEANIHPFLFIFFLTDQLFQPLFLDLFSTHETPELPMSRTPYRVYSCANDRFVLSASGHLCQCNMSVGRATENLYPPLY